MNLDANKGGIFMKGLAKKVITALATVGMAVTPMRTVFGVQQVQQKLLSLGASLQGAQITQTRSLLGATDVPEANTIYVDGNTVNQYLSDGSNANTIVYSSAVIEPQAEGFGVQVQIVTPQNIKLVTPLSYQNAAITSGAKNVLIKIATVSPVTGEGALAGVYALLNKAGIKVSQQAIQVAEKEIKVVEQAKQQQQLTDIQINQIIADIKKEVTNHIVNNVTIDQTQSTIIVNNVLNKYNIQTQNFDATELVNYAVDFSKTEVAKSQDTVKQLEASVDKAIWNEAKSEQLRQFMQTWQVGMNQVYTEFRPGSPGDYYGVSIPNDILNKMAVNGQKVNAEWSAQGVTPGVYNIVATYADHGTGNGEDDHLYLFAIIDGAPVVLHTQKKNIEGQEVINFTPTENVDLRNNFAELVKGTQASQLSQVVEPSTALSANWNTGKAQALRQYMVEWGNMMGQSYKEITPTSTEDYHGATMPNYGIEHFALGEHRVPAQWSATGTDSSVNIVASYVQMDSGTSPTRHLYFFAIVDGLPVVYHSSQNQGGAPEDGFYFHETDNVDLRNKFNEIANSAIEPLPEETTAKWNETKMQALRQYMVEWSNVMGQSYKEITPTSTEDYFGATMPTHGVEFFALGNHRVPAQWSADAAAPGTNIVASYVQVDNADPMLRHIYFFAIVDGKPVVYHSNQNQGGAPEDGFYFHETENVDLKSAFENIVNN